MSHYIALLSLVHAVFSIIIATRGTFSIILIRTGPRRQLQGNNGTTQIKAHYDWGCNWDSKDTDEAVDRVICIWRKMACGRVECVSSAQRQKLILIASLNKRTIMGIELFSWFEFCFVLCWGGGGWWLRLRSRMIADDTIMTMIYATQLNLVDTDGQRALGAAACSRNNDRFMGQRQRQNDDAMALKRALISDISHSSFKLHFVCTHVASWCPGDGLDLGL